MISLQNTTYCLTATHLDSHFSKLVG